MQTKNSLAQMKIAGSMKSSTEVMKSMSTLIKIPEMQKTMQELSKEMMKAGIIDEMIQDSMDSVLDADDADLDSVADAEVEKIILEITQGKLSTLPSVNKTQPAGTSQDMASALVDEDEEPEEDMSKRLEALRN
jgi:charged multivesicular body protein 3